MRVTVLLHMKQDNLVGDEVYREELEIPVDEVYWKPFDINCFVETDYIRDRIIPYMDMLHDYEFVTIEYP